MSSPLISFDLRAFGQHDQQPRAQRRSLVSVIASVLVAVGAAACGGGGGGAALDGTQTSTAVAMSLAASAPTSSVPAAGGLDTSAVSSDNALQPPTPSNSEVVGTARDRKSVV